MLSCCDNFCSVKKCHIKTLPSTSLPLTWMRVRLTFWCLEIPRDESTCRYCLLTLDGGVCALNINIWP